MDSANCGPCSPIVFAVEKVAHKWICIVQMCIFQGSIIFCEEKCWYNYLSWELNIYNLWKSSFTWKHWLLFICGYLVDIFLNNVNLSIQRKHLPILVIYDKVQAFKCKSLCRKACICYGMPVNLPILKRFLWWNCW